MNYRDIKYELHALVLLVAFAIAMLRNEYNYLVLGALIAFGIMLGFRRKEFLAGRWFTNAANWVTLARLMAILLAVMNYHTMSSVQFAGIMLVAVLLDALDGYIARRYGVSTEAGADLDMETDAFYVVCMSLIVFTDHAAGYLVLTAGLLRYIFVWLLRLTGLYRTAMPKLRWSRQIAAIYFIALLLPFVCENQTCSWLLNFAAGLVCLSFLEELVLRMRQV